jgi:hypothetical protein
MKAAAEELTAVAGKPEAEAKRDGLIESMRDALFDLQTGD